MSHPLTRCIVTILLAAGIGGSAVPRLAAGAMMPDERCARQHHSCDNAGLALKCCCGHDADDAQYPAQTESRTQLNAPSAVALAPGAWMTATLAVPGRCLPRVVPPRARSAPDRLALISTLLI
jgi:hypothetical protein